DRARDLGGPEGGRAGVEVVAVVARRDLPRRVGEQEPELDEVGVAVEAGPDVALAELGAAVRGSQGPAAVAGLAVDAPAEPVGPVRVRLVAKDVRVVVRPRAGRGDPLALVLADRAFLVAAVALDVPVDAAAVGVVVVRGL